MRRVLLSPSVSFGKRIDYLFCSENGWLAISEQDKDMFFEGEKLINQELSNFELLEESKLYERIPLLKGKLIEGIEKFIHIDYENGKIYVNPKHETRSFFTDTSARATNQTNFEVNIWTYMKLRKSRFIKILGVFILVLYLSFAVSWAFLNLFFCLLFLIYHNTMNGLDMYQLGTLNASVVVTQNPTRIAVLTDVSLGYGKYPLVRIIKANIPKSYNKLYERVPVSCGYQNAEDQKHWDFVVVHPIVFATANDQIIRQKINEIPTKDWLELKNWVNANRNNFYEGYYPIRDGLNSWQQTSDPKFISFYEEENPLKKGDKSK